MLSVCVLAPPVGAFLVLLWVLARLPQFVLMDVHVWKCLVHLHPGIGPLPPLWYGMLKYPVKCNSYRERLIFTGPLDGSGGAKFVLSAAKLAIRSYINHGRLQGWHQVSQPMVYKMVYDSEVAWDDVVDLTSEDCAVCEPEQEEGQTIFASSQKQQDQESESSRPQEQELDAEVQPAMKLQRVRGKKSPQALYVDPGAGSSAGPGAGSSACPGAGSSGQVVPHAGQNMSASPGAGSSAQVVPHAGDGLSTCPDAGLSAQEGLCAGAGSSSIRFISLLQCKCRGNCGDLICKQVQNKKTRKRKLLPDDVICSRVPLPGSELCRRCQCEFCGGPRSHQDTNGRWCLSKTCGDKGETRLAYTTQSGQHNFSPQWSREIRFICKFNYALSLLDPGDLSVGHDTCSQLWCRFGPPTPGQKVPAMVLFCLVWIHALKWPAAVLAFGCKLAKYKPSQDIADDFVAMLTDSIVHCHGQVWDSVFAGMHSGGANFAHGPVAVGKQLGILTPAMQAGLPAAQQVLTLGKEQKSYMVNADKSVAHNIVEYIYNAAEKVSLTWPSDDAELEKFADVLKEFTMDIRSHRDDAGFGLQGAGDPNLYTVKHFMRFVLLLTEGCTDQKRISWETVLEWTPDNSQRCQVFKGKTANDVRRLVGLPALKVSMFACLAGKLSTLKLTEKQWQSLMKLTDGQVMKCLRQHWSAHKDIPREEYWPPGCKELVQILQKAGLV